MSAARLVFIGLSLGLIVATFASVGALAEELHFKATLDGMQNVPPRPEVTATGTATLVLNEAQTELSFFIEYGGLVGAETDAHIHNATPRENGPIVFQLPAGNPKSGVWQITPFYVSELLANRLYVNIHTDVYISGEVRGNIMRETVPVQNRTFGAIKALYGF